VKNAAARRRKPAFLSRRAQYFEQRVEQSIEKFSRELSDASLVLFAGSGEGLYKPAFGQHRYVGIDLALADATRDYGSVDALVDLAHLPFAGERFDASLSVATLEHAPEPFEVVAEIFRTLRPGGRLLVAVPHEWEVHLHPHDYFRFTRYGIRHLLERAGFVEIRVLAVGGLFRLLSRRLFQVTRYFRGLWYPLVVVVLAPAALIAPLFDSLDRGRDFTLGYICTARKPDSA
jgi:SAM-dependent methyltransferase